MNHKKMPSKAKGLLITAVEPDSPLSDCGVAPGERLLAIDGETVRDALDLAYLEAEEELTIDILTCIGELRQIDIEKSYDTPLGIELESKPPLTCANTCVFCFIDQNPPGLRPTLYVKDEDYRLSFTHGHYITGTSLKETDLERIETMRFSPLYISVHATDPKLRGRLLGHSRNADVMPLLNRLAESGIELHTQIVLVPGWNDGDALDQSLSDLARIGEALLSIAIVPLGLTNHRDSLEELRLFTPDEARGVIEQVEKYQQHFLEERGERIALAADELYLLAGLEPPEYSDDERLYQYENGVGMVDAIRREWAESRPDWPKAVSTPMRCHILTGRLAACVIAPLYAQLCDAVEGLTGRVMEVENQLYGDTVSVAGLLGGADFDRVLRAIPPEDQPDIALIPRSALREEGDLFLDGMSLDELRGKHEEIRIEPVDEDIDTLLEIIM